jgi:hypothetical protein
MDENPQSQGMKYCLPLKLPIFFKFSGTLSQVRDLGYVDLFDQPLVDVDL